MTAAGQFDPNTFLDMTMTDANSTVSTPVPEGEYIGIISGDPEVRTWQGRKDPTKSGLALDITWDVDDAAVKALLQRDRITVKQGIMLDLNEGGGLDTGKGRNVSLGRLRDAVGLNQSGQPFNFRMLAGKVAKIAIKHRIDGDAIYAEVKGVARA